MFFKNLNSLTPINYLINCPPIMNCQKYKIFYTTETMIKGWSLSME